MDYYNTYTIVFLMLTLVVSFIFSDVKKTRKQLEEMDKKIHSLTQMKNNM